MRKNSLRWMAVVPLLALAACGQEAASEHTMQQHEEIVAALPSSGETGAVRIDEGSAEPVMDGCVASDGGGGGGEYKKNTPDQECRLAAKYNEDIDEGESPSNYDAFKGSMAAAGFYTPGVGTSTGAAANKKMGEDQAILTGSEFEVTLDTSGPISAETWTSLN